MMFSGSGVSTIPWQLLNLNHPTPCDVLASASSPSGGSGGAGEAHVFFSAM